MVVKMTGDLKEDLNTLMMNGVKKSTQDMNKKSSDWNKTFNYLMKTTIRQLKPKN